MRRLNPLAVRLGYSADWLARTKIRNSVLTTPWLLRFSLRLTERINNMQRDRVRRRVRVSFRLSFALRQLRFYRKVFRRATRKFLKRFEKRKNRNRKSFFYQRIIFFKKKKRSTFLIHNFFSFTYYPKFFYFPFVGFSFKKKKKLDNCASFRSWHRYCRSAFFRKNSVFVGHRPSRSLLRNNRFYSVKSYGVLRKLFFLKGAFSRPLVLSTRCFFGLFFLSFKRRARYLRQMFYKERKFCKKRYIRFFNKKTFKKYSRFNFSFVSNGYVSSIFSYQQFFNKKKHFKNLKRSVTPKPHKGKIFKEFKNKNVLKKNKRFFSSLVFRKSSQFFSLSRIFSVPLLYSSCARSWLFFSTNSVGAAAHPRQTSGFSSSKHQELKKKNKFFLKKKKLKRRSRINFYKNRWSWLSAVLWRWHKKRVSIFTSLQNNSILLGKNFFYSVRRRRFFQSLYANSEFREARISCLVKRASQFVQIFRKRRWFVRRKAIRVIRVKPQVRRRSIFCPMILFFRAQITPRWNSRKWLRAPLRYHFRNYGKLSFRLGYFARRRFRLARKSRFAKNTLRRFVFLNSVERQLTGFKSSSLVGCNFFFTQPSVRNSQLYFFTSPFAMKLLYQNSVHKKLSRFYRRRGTYSFFSSLLACAFLWRNVFLFASVLGVEFRKTRYHYRFFKLFSRFLSVFISTRATVINMVVRVRGCFGKIARTRSLYLRPLSKFHISLQFKNINAPLKFSFRNVVTRRGVFGLAVWIV